MIIWNNHNIIILKIYFVLFKKKKKKIEFKVNNWLRERNFSNEKLIFFRIKVDLQERMERVLIFDKLGIKIWQWN